MSAEFIRQAVHGEHRVVMLRCYDDANGSVVEAAVAPLEGGAPVPRGPYRFATAHEAFRFLQEATLALQYLGCTIS